MGLEASVQFEDDPRIAADGEFEAELVEQADNETESADSEREDDALATRREELSVQRTLDATQMRSGSNFSTARIRPRLPSSIRSSNDNPRLR